MVRIRRVNYVLSDRGRSYKQNGLFRKDIKKSAEPRMEEDIQIAAREGFEEMQYRTPIVSGDLYRSERRTPTGFYTGAGTLAPYDVVVEALYQSGGGRRPNPDGKGFVEGGRDAMIEKLRDLGYRGQVRKRGKLQIGAVGRRFERGKRLGGSQRSGQD